ncbi:hypothetical protein TPHA_0C03810 [Tetrapisispora phaffii CBS 4417]|uniref:Ketoreductase (KR) domain-containing protein n=1 Tax=Tetrapisispora phaffii (strain ATCC 24235 / CBS 4417 / NBRC 1672 / NRRL Y-8282 / UCD 70-5) TaxID=1071381 RepID=G8BQM1_TETPH|nr:hypothetical protein TPHA_0C03810 [Tetrapisispora phaffii CBS 4417]CCE62533.1 hypothetical protein TPHA_0C03810 [Tetrapisispora phaffii CBS 4417]
MFDLNGIYNSMKSFYDLCWLGKSLNPKDVVVLLGGSDAFGTQLCQQLINEDVVVVNIDSLDNSNELLLDINSPKQQYYFIPCDSFEDVNHMKSAINKVAQTKLTPTIFLNNINFEFETILKDSNTECNDLSSDYVKYFQKTIMINLENVMVSTKYFLNNFINPDFYYVINVSIDIKDVYSWEGSRFRTSKMALNQYHDSLVSELNEMYWEKNLDIKNILFYLPYKHLNYSEYVSSCKQLSINAVSHLKNGERGPIQL